MKGTCSIILGPPPRPHYNPQIGASVRKLEYRPVCAAMRRVCLMAIDSSIGNFGRRLIVCSNSVRHGHSIVWTVRSTSYNTPCSVRRIVSKPRFLSYIVVVVIVVVALWAAGKRIGREELSRVGSCLFCAPAGSCLISLWRLFPLRQKAPNLNVFSFSNIFISLDPPTFKIGFIFASAQLLRRFHRRLCVVCVCAPSLSC